MHLLTLPDGSAAALRPIRPDDAPAHRRLISRLSAISRYKRFMHAVAELSQAETERFVTVDGHERVALVAEDPGRPGELIGIARFDRESDQSRAEVAIVVDDAWQGRGLGTVLLRDLVEIARTQGVRTLVANILAGNARSLALFHDLNLPERSHLEDGVVVLELQLSEPPSSEPTGEGGS